MPVRLAESGLLAVNLTLVIELIGFLVMLGILARYVYPPLIRAAQARQQQIADQLRTAEAARKEAEEHLAQAQRSVQEARVESQQIIEAGRRAGEQAGQQEKDRAEQEARRLVEQAHRDIEAERQRALHGLREQVAQMVTSATEKVVGETLTPERHRKLIERALDEVTVSEATPGA